MNTARRMRVVLDERGAARRPAGRIGIVAVIVACVVAYVIAAHILGGKRL